MTRIDRMWNAGARDAASDLRNGIGMLDTKAGAYTGIKGECSTDELIAYTDGYTYHMNNN